MEDDTNKSDAPEKEITSVVKDDNDSNQSISKSPIDNSTEEARENEIESKETSPLKVKTSKHTLQTPEKEGSQKDDDRKRSPSSPSTPQSKSSPDKKSPSSSHSNKTPSSSNTSSEQQNRPPDKDKKEREGSSSSSSATTKTPSGSSTSGLEDLSLSDYLTSKYVV